MSYCFRKLYLDWISDDGSVSVLTLAWVHLFGWHGRAALDVYRPDGRVLHERGIALPVRSEPPMLELPLRVELRSGSLVLDADVVHPAWKPLQGPPNAALRWKVLAARVEGVLQIAGVAGVSCIAGHGYADWVELTEWSRRVGFRELVWGRVHMRDASVVFEDVSFEDGSRWRVGAKWNGSGGPEETDVGVELDGIGRGRLELSTGTTIELAAERVLVQGDAFGPERMPSWTDRVLARLIGGRTEQVRFLGRARTGAEVGAALYESVRFNSG